MKTFMYPYKMSSSSAKKLAKMLNIKRVFPDGKFKNKRNNFIINWGNSHYPNWPIHRVLNHPDNVRLASNKLFSFRKFKEADVKHPQWTTDYDTACHWVEEGFTIVVRKTITGSGGKGVIIVKGEEELPIAPLYTKYFKKKEEYRIHVVYGKMIDYSLKKKRKGKEVDFQVRSWDNGWVFCRENVVVPKCIEEEAIKAVKALGLHFGAVDIGYNVTKNEPCVFEVNTAPGIEGTTIIKYATAFKEEYNV